MLLFLTQTSLVAAGRTDIHRRLGVAGALLAPLLLVVGYLTAIESPRLGHTPPGGPPLAFLAVPIGTLAVFASLVGAGHSQRRRRPSRARVRVGPPRYHPASPPALQAGPGSFGLHGSAGGARTGPAGPALPLVARRADLTEAGPRPRRPRFVPANTHPAAARVAGAQRGTDVRLITMKDACEPESFGAAGVGCLRNGGILFDKFIGQLGKHEIMRAWHFVPSVLHAKVGRP
jgi:hypothetical protein